MFTLTKTTKQLQRENMKDNTCIQRNKEIKFKELKENMGTNHYQRRSLEIENIKENKIEILN